MHREENYLNENGQTKKWMKKMEGWNIDPKIMWKGELLRNGMMTSRKEQKSEEDRWSSQKEEKKGDKKKQNMDPKILLRNGQKK